jgi:hypothetical protein
MDKRLFGIGVMLLLVGILLAAASEQATQAVLPNANNTQTDRAILGNYLSGYIALPVNSTSLVDFEYTSINATDFYMVNDSAFGKLLPLINANKSIRSAAMALEGNGLMIAYLNQTKGSFPYDASFSGILPTPNYTSANTSVLAPGLYYVVFTNDKNAPNMVLYSVLVRPISAVGISQSSSAGFGVIGDVIVLAGLVLMVYSFFTKRENELPKLQQDIDRMYDELGLVEKRRRPRKAKRMHSGKKQRGA